MSKPETPKPASASLIRPLLDAARTVVMIVDDDPGVSRAVARDLGRRYGGSYRIVRAESGESALEGAAGAEAARRPRGAGDHQEAHTRHSGHRCGERGPTCRT